MMGGNEIKEGNQLSSTYVQDMDKRAVTYGADAGTNSRSIAYVNNIPITCSDNLVVDLNHHYTEQYLLPDLNTMTNFQGFCYPGWNLNELPLDAHKTLVSDSSMSERINNLVDTKEITSMLFDKPGGDVSIQSAVENNWPSIDDGLLSLGIDASAQVKSEYCVNQNGSTNKSLNSYHVQKAIGESTSFNDDVRSVCGSYDYPSSSQLLTLQNTNDMLRNYPNLDHKKQLGGSSSEMSYFGNISASLMGSETVNTSLTSTPPNRHQLMRYMQTIKNISLESSTVSSAIRANGSSMTQENTGQVSPFGSFSAQDANKISQPLKRKLIQPDGSMYGVKVGQFPNNTGLEASKDSVLQGQLISNLKNDGLSQASHVVGGSSRKRVAKKSPPEAPKLQRKKTTKNPPPVVPPVTCATNIATPPVVPRVQRKNNIISNIAPNPPAAPRVQRKNNIISNIAPNPPAAPRVQRKSKIVPSVPSVAPAHPSTSKVQITNITSIPPSVAPTPPATQRVRRNSKTVSSAPYPTPASAVQIASITAPPPIISSVRYQPSVAPPVRNPVSVTPPIISKPRGTKKKDMPVVAPKVQSNISSTVIPSSLYQPSVGPLAFTRPVDPRVQISANSPTAAPTLTAAPPAVIPPSPFVKVVPPWMTNTRPVTRVSPNIPSVAMDPPVPASPERIKWQDPDEKTPPLGERCMICKRDLLFTAQGPVFQPAFPPSAAVLPCGHTFHDDCLKGITPIDQAANPPCIPCVIGEY